MEKHDLHEPNDCALCVGMWETFFSTTQPQDLHREEQERQEKYNAILRRDGLDSLSHTARAGAKEGERPNKSRAVLTRAAPK